MLISVVIPVFNSSECLNVLYTRLSAMFNQKRWSYEIVLINDGSADNSWDIIKSLSKKDRHIVGVNLTKNFGQHPAIAVGLSIAKGNWTIVMDADLQDRPENIPELYYKTKEGYDVVFARRLYKNRNRLYGLFVKGYHATLSAMTGTYSDEFIGNFSIFSNNIRNKLLAFPMLPNSFLQSIRRIASNAAFVNVTHDNRYAGTSTYTFRSLVRLAYVSIKCWRVPLTRHKKQSFAPMIAERVTSQ